MGNADWARFVRDIAAQYPRANRITLVMDNLNTHRPGALYEAFEPAEAKALSDRFEFVYTPTHRSWLNVAEVELNVMIRQCLNRRIDSIDSCAPKSPPGRRPETGSEPRSTGSSSSPAGGLSHSDMPVSRVLPRRRVGG